MRKVFTENGTRLVSARKMEHFHRRKKRQNKTRK